MPLFNCAGGNGGGGGGTSDYEQLSNLPQINNNILIGNKSASDLGLVGAVTGKGLSTNDYTDADKAIVDGVTSALADKVDKVAGKGLSTNDYDNTAKGIVDGVTSALAGKVDASLVGSANGVAELDANGRVPSSQLPSYVDDVLEYADLAHFPATGETGKIYIAEDTNKTYRWSGSGYAEISESLALGETSSTAYAGNKGKANADAIAAIKDGTNIDSFGDVETALAGKANRSDLGDKSNLTTTDKSSCVGAINEVNNNLKPSSAVLLQANSISGITITWENNEDIAHIAYRVGNLVIINVSCSVTGTYSGESTWFNLFDMPSSLLKSGEQFMDSVPVSIIASTTNGNSFDNNRIVRGRQILLTQNQSYDSHFGYQIIVGVVSQ